MKKNLWIQKGNAGYVAHRRIWNIAKTILFFSVSIILYIAGVKATGSNKNLLTVAAVLGCLPAGKSAVNMIMFLRYKGCPKEDATLFAKKYENIISLFDLVFTSYERNYEIYHMGIQAQNVCAYTTNPKCDIAGCEKHLQDMLKKNGLKNMTVKVFTEKNKYVNRLEQLDLLENSKKVCEEIKQLMLDISL